MVKHMKVVVSDAEDCCVICVLKLDLEHKANKITGTTIKPSL
jgi:hypothetical protein